jgi:hypothetical protein
VARVFLWFRWLGFGELDLYQLWLGFGELELGLEPVFIYCFELLLLLITIIASHQACIVSSAAYTFGMFATSSKVSST